MAAVRARSVATCLFTDWCASANHHNTDWQMRARAKRAPSESFNGKLSTKGYFTFHYPSDNANGTSTLLNIYTSDRQYNYNIHRYSFIRESTHIIAHTNRVYVDSHSLGQLALASKTHQLVSQICEHISNSF